MNEKEARYWIDFLDAQIAFLYGQLALARADHPGIMDADSFAFLLVPDQSESAVEVFIRTDKWPPLNASGLRSLYHRATAAKVPLQAIVNCEPMPPKMVIPIASDRPQVIRWLFIYIWNAVGRAYVERVSTVFGHST